MYFRNICPLKLVPLYVCGVRKTYGVPIWEEMGKYISAATSTRHINGHTIQAGGGRVNIVKLISEAKMSKKACQVSSLMYEKKSFPKKKAMEDIWGVNMGERLKGKVTEIILPKWPIIESFSTHKKYFFEFTFFKEMSENIQYTTSPAYQLFIL